MEKEEKYMVKTGYAKSITKIKQGKKNKAAGQRFELRVRKDLFKKGWIVSKWMNNVEFHNAEDVNEFTFDVGTLIPAKHKFRGPGIPMAIGTGFPDFISYQKGCGFDADMQMIVRKDVHDHLIMVGVEVKSNGYLDKIEKQKCKWLLANNIFSKILIAKKGKKRGEIIYKEFS